MRGWCSWRGGSYTGHPVAVCSRPAPLSEPASAADPSRCALRSRPRTRGVSPRSAKPATAAATGPAPPPEFALFLLGLAETFFERPLAPHSCDARLIRRVGDLLVAVSSLLLENALQCSSSVVRSGFCVFRCCSGSHSTSAAPLMEVLLFSGSALARRRRRRGLAPAL